MKLKEILKIYNKNSYSSYVFDGRISEFDDLFEKNESKKKKITLLKRINMIFNYPMLFLHEFMHLIVSLLLFNKVNRFYLSSPFDDCVHGYVQYPDLPKRKLIHLLINLAPSLILLIALILPFINIWFLLFTFYSFLTIKTLIPSKTDIFSVLLFNYSKEMDEMSFIDFLDRCVENIEYYELIKQLKQLKQE